jgi:hypothetical protein
MEVSMKTQNGSKVWIAVLVAMLALLGCPTDSDPAKNGAAALTSISVAGTAVATVPKPVSQSEWDGVEALTNVEQEQLGMVIIPNSASLANAAIVVVASSGAQVRYASASSALNKPEADDFQDGPITFTFYKGNYLVIQVTAGDGGAVNYYVVEIYIQDNTTNLDAVMVGDVVPELGTPDADWEKAVAGSVTLGGAVKSNVKINVTKSKATQIVEFAKVTGGAAPSFGDTDTFDFEDGDFLYIRVIAENGDTNIYKIEIWSDRSAVPIISPEELPNAAYTLNEAAVPLAVTVSLQDLEEMPSTSTITYQWYSNTTASNSGGTLISDATDASFTPPTAALGTTWYYVKVSHTDSAKSGTASAFSSPVRIRVVQTVEKVESIVAGSSNTVVYRFTLPLEKKWSDYTRITWEVLIDDMTTINMAATRAHIVGNYQENVFNATTGVFEKGSNWNDARLVTISNSGSMSAILGSDYEPHTWKALSYSIAEDNSLKDSTYNAGTYYPIADAVGPFYFGIGLSVNPNNNGTGVCRYFVRRMALSNEDGTDKVYADELTTSWGDGLTLMDLKCIFNTATQIERSLVNNPVPDEE